jgi:O-antigen/teichoic acid export membrane protein
VAGIGFYLMSIFTNFAFRTVFIYFFSKEYLGIQGVFTNILSLLSLAEMGIGSAMTFSMYKPIAQNDENKICALLQLYKKVYIIIALAIAIIGCLLTPHLDFFVQTRPNIPESIEFIFLLYVANTVLSYLIIHKQSILQADQNAFVVTVWTNVFMVFRYILQIIWICIFKTFIPTLVIQIILTICGNLWISYIAEKRYPYIKINSKQKISKVEMRELVIKIRAMLLYRIGAYVVNSTDNLLISKFIGVISVGIFSNYIMLLGLAKSVTIYISTALTPSIGNQAETQSLDKISHVFGTLYFFFFWMSASTTICFAVLLNPFVKLWIGDGFLLSNATVFFLVVNYYILMMRRIMVSYRNALGLYEVARWKPVVEAAINIIASLVLLKYLGVLGVVIGTTISEVTTSLWIEPYVMYKYYFKTGQKNYWKRYVQYSLITATLSLLMILIRDFFYNGSVISFMIITVLSILIPNGIICLIFRSTAEYKELMVRVNVMIGKFKIKFKS